MWRMTSAASSSGVRAAMNSARPISSRRSAGIFGMLDSFFCAGGAGLEELIHHRGTEVTEIVSPPCPLCLCGEYYVSIGRHAVEALRVVAEDLLLEFGRDVVAVGEMGDRVGEFAVPMRIIGGEQDVLLGEEIGDVAQRLLFRLAGHIDAAARHVLRRLHLEERRLEATELVLLVHMLHP